MFTGPHTTFSNSLDRILWHLSAVGTALREEFVATVDVCLQGVLLSLGHLTRIVAEVGKLVGLDCVGVNANLFVNQFFCYREYTEDTNGTCQCGWFCNDVVGSTRNVVTARSSITTHRNDDRLLRLDVHHLMPNLFAGESATTRGIHTHHNSFHIVVVCQVLQVFSHLVSGNDFSHATKRRLIRLYYLACCIIHSNHIAACTFWFRRGAGCQICYRNGVVVTCRCLVHAVSQHLWHFVGECHFVNQLLLQVVVCLFECQSFVCQLVQLFAGELARLGNFALHLLPDFIAEHSDLLAVGIAHLCQEVWFNGTLIGSYLENLHLHAHLVEHILVV